MLEGSLLRWPTARQRRWTVLRHKVKTMAFRSPLNVFTSMLAAPPTFTWRSYLIAGAEELNKELEWATSRKTSCSAGRELHVEDGGPTVFFDALTTSEQAIVKRYRQLAPSTGSVCSLGQSPFDTDQGDSFAHFVKGDTMHTIIKHVGLQWVIHEAATNKVERWLTPHEVLVCQCFPVYSNLPGFECTSFSVHRAGRTRAAIFAQAGNSMPLSMAGLLYLFACIGVARTDTPFIRDLRFAQRAKRARGTEEEDDDSESARRLRLRLS